MQMERYRRCGVFFRWCKMLRDCGLILLMFIGFINGAVTASVRLPEINDLEPASVVVDFNRLDPRNQAVSSSYSILETSDSREPGRFSYAANEYEPQVQSSKYRGFKDVSEEETPSSFYDSFVNDDDEPSRSKEFIRDDFFSARQAKKEPTRRPKPRPSRPRKAEQQQQREKTHPKSINEIVEESEPKSSSSGVRKSANVKNGDLNRSGSYARGKLGEDESYEEGHEREKHYDKEDGKKFVEAHKAESGEKADQGYSKEEVYDKAEKEKHDKEEKKAVIGEKESAKKGHQEEEKHFGEEYKGEEGEKGISIKKKGGHKKGHKKSGFHKVHHKDEFKKDEVFYDEGHNGDEHEEHAHEHEKHHKEKGGAAKKQHLDTAYHEGHGEKKGLQDKGHHFEEASGHKKEAGEEKHHDQHSKYGKKGGVKEGAKFGHSEGGAKEGGYFDEGY